MAIASINPATGEKLKEFSPFDDAEIEKRLSRAEQAFKRYRRTTLPERAELLHDVSELLFQERQRFAEIITLEMGNCSAIQSQKSRSARVVAGFTRRTARDFSRRNPRRPTQLKVTSSISRSDRYWR